MSNSQRLNLQNFNWQQVNRVWYIPLKRGNTCCDYIRNYSPLKRQWHHKSALTTPLTPLNNYYWLSLWCVPCCCTELPPCFSRSQHINFDLFPSFGKSTFCLHVQILSGQPCCALINIARFLLAILAFIDAESFQNALPPKFRAHFVCSYKCFRLTWRALFRQFNAYYASSSRFAISRVLSPVFGNALQPCFLSRTCFKPKPYYSWELQPSSW